MSIRGRKACKQMQLTNKKGNNIIRNGRDWTGLPEALLEMIAERLAVIDCLSFRKVCKVWRKVLAAASSTCKQSSVLPWLLTFGATQSTTRTCFSILEKKAYHVEMPKACGKYLWGSFQNWLIMVKQCDDLIQPFLLNPFTGIEVPLPPAMDLYHKLVLSGGCDLSEPSCIYMMLHEALCELALWVPGSRGWLRCEIDPDDREIKDAVFFNGRFYLLLNDCNIRIIDPASIYSMIKTEGPDVVPGKTRRVVSGLKNEFHKVEMQAGGLLTGNNCHVTNHLLESCGEILLVRRFFRSAGDVDALVTYATFKVYRLDFCQMVWVFVDDLGNRVLFVGKNCSFSSSAKELGASRGNCIYFTNERLCASLNDFDYTLSEISETDDWDIYELITDEPSASISRGIWISVPLWHYCQENSPVEKNLI